LIGALKVDWYLVSDDFGSYLDANKLVDEAYKDKDSWAEKYHPPSNKLTKINFDSCKHGILQL
jgi:glycogen phosphorylase